MDQATATFLAAVVALCGAVVSAVLAYRQISARGAVERDLAVMKARLDDRIGYAAEAVVRELLSHDTWKLRSFATIKSVLGGYTDDELRQILVRAGAIRVYESGEELWGLLERNRDKLNEQRLIPGRPNS